MGRTSRRRFGKREVADALEGLGINLDPAYVEPASKRLAERGYLPLIDLMRIVTSCSQ